MDSITVNSLTTQCLQVFREFQSINEREWTVEARYIELGKQVGDLGRMIMMYERYYSQSERGDNPAYATGLEQIGNELADIFYCLVLIADHYGIDLEQSILDARRQELENLQCLREEQHHAQS